MHTNSTSNQLILHRSILGPFYLWQLQGQLMAAQHRLKRVARLAREHLPDLLLVGEKTACVSVRQLDDFRQYQNRMLDPRAWPEGVEGGRLQDCIFIIPTDAASIFVISNFQSP